MLVGVILAKTMKEMATKAKAIPDELDLLELRLDFCEDLNLEELAKIKLPKPVLFTLRHQGQGGKYTAEPKERLALWLQLLALKPDYIDLESDFGDENILSIAKHYETSKIILSHHNFDNTPVNKELEATISKMQGLLPRAIYKIAAKANSTLDTLRMLALSKKYKGQLIGISMGELGETSRILTPVLGAGFSYTPIDESSAPGQLAIQTLMNTYNFKSLTPTTKIYGLLGNPVKHSIGHIFHNKRNTNAVYVKWCIAPEELTEAFTLLKEIEVQGLSLTMPLKESCLPLLDKLEETAKHIGAVNTIVVQNHIWTGHNTDGAGTLQALQTSLAEKSVFVLGAGGAARAIIYTAATQAAKVLVFNRTLAKAKAMAEEFMQNNKQLCQIEAYALESLETMAKEQGYDLLVNTLPSTTEAMPDDVFLAGKTVMDITYSHHSQFLEQAEKKNCKTFDGKSMFIEQALLQRKLWGLTE